MINKIDKALWPIYMKELEKNFQLYFNADKLFDFLRKYPSTRLVDAVIKVINYSFVRMKLEKILLAAGFTETDFIDDKSFNDFMDKWGTTQEDTTKRIFINNKFTKLVFEELNKFVEGKKIVLYGNLPTNKMWTESFYFTKSTDYSGEYELTYFDDDYADFDSLEEVSKWIDFIKLG